MCICERNEKPTDLITVAPTVVFAAPTEVAGDVLTTKHLTFKCGTKK